MTLLIVSFLVLMVVGIPVAISMAVASLLYLLVYDVAPDVILAQRMIAGVESFPLLAVPFFILAGNLMNIAGVTGRIYSFALALVGWMKGGLAQVNIIGSVIFSGMSGTALADAAGIGTIEIKAMKDHGYPVEAAVGVTAASATLGPIFPPSLPFVIYGMMANVSIGALFMAGILPGVVMTVLMMVTVAMFAYKRGWGSDTPFAWKRLAEASLEVVIVLGFPLIVYGLIWAGLSLNVAVAISLVVPDRARLVFRLLRRDGADDPDHPDRRHDHGLVHADGSGDGGRHLVAVPGPRALPHHDIPHARQSELRHDRDDGVRPVHRHRRVDLRLAADGQPGGAGVSRTSSSLTDNKWVFLILVNILMLVVGCFLDTIAAITILVPILLPIVLQFGIDPVHFGLIMTLNLMIGLLHPPLGMVLFVLSRVAKLSVERTTMAILPWLVPLFVALILITFVPAITLWLPTQMGLIR